MRESIIVVIFLFGCFLQPAMSQAVYRTGNADPVNTRHVQGVVLAGGATDNDDAMRWMLRQADGGDIVVLRASGSDGYNNYFYSGLGVNVNSVTSIVITSQGHANSQQVLDIVKEAEVVFIAGGNQWNYLRYWRDTELLTLLNELVNDKKITIGGTSAGMAILGEVVFSAENNTIWSSEALGDPFHWRMKLEKDFLQIPYMEFTVTDTHYNREETDGFGRKGRHFAFLARMVGDWRMHARGIACNEYTAVAIDERGVAKVFGNPDHDDYAYFLQAYEGDPEHNEEGVPLDWNNNRKAVRVYKIKGDHEGSNRFDLNNWVNGRGGKWEYWYVDKGTLVEREAVQYATWLQVRIFEESEKKTVGEAQVSLSGYEPATTSSFGVVNYESLQPGTLPELYVEKEGYLPWEGNVPIDTVNIAIEIYIERDQTNYSLRSGDQSSFRIFPNPAVDIIWIDPGPGQEEFLRDHIPVPTTLDERALYQGDVRLIIRSASGSLVEILRTGCCSGSPVPINISHLPDGVYFIEIAGRKSRAVKKFVKSGYQP